MKLNARRKRIIYKDKVYRNISLSKKVIKYKNKIYIQTCPLVSKNGIRYYEDEFIELNPDLKINDKEVEELT